MSNTDRIGEILKDSNQHPMAALGALLPELTRLRELVKAQKELIDLLDKADRMGWMQDATMVNELRNRIKELEAWQNRHN